MLASSQTNRPVSRLRTSLYAKKISRRARQVREQGAGAGEDAAASAGTGTGSAAQTQQMTNSAAIPSPPAEGTPIVDIEMGNDFQSIFDKPKPKPKKKQPAAQTFTTESIADELKSDISRFEKPKVEVEDKFKSLKDAFGFILIADFFVVIFFLVWFLAAAAMQSTNAWLLERFQDIFQPVVVPSLTVLMAGSMASGAIEKLGEKKNP